MKTTAGRGLNDEVKPQFHAMNEALAARAAR
jgi:hypothetical protein